MGDVAKARPRRKIDTKFVAARRTKERVFTDEAEPSFALVFTTRDPWGGTEEIPNAWSFRKLCDAMGAERWWYAGPDPTQPDVYIFQRFSED